MAEKHNWTREELILAFNLYCKTPFSKINYRLPSIQKLANVIGRTPSAVAWKLVNFASFDPILSQKNISGAKNTSKLDKQIFDEFYSDWNALAIESELLYEKYLSSPNNEEPCVDYDAYQSYVGKTKETKVMQRVNQSFFRQVVLATYENRCCITGLSNPSLLIASHIVPWAKDEANRLNPENGLCLNSLHDRAFDQGLITLDEDYRVCLSHEIRQMMPASVAQTYFGQYEGKSIVVPQRFRPKKDFLEYHRNNIFKN